MNQVVGKKVVVQIKTILVLAWKKLFGRLIIKQLKLSKNNSQKL
jgi:hypothetical protein